MSSPPLSVAHSVAFDQGPLCTVNEVWQWAHAHGYHWSHLISHHLKEAGLRKQWGD